MRITIPFRAHFRDAIIQGRKTVTSRTRKYGKPGDEFEAFGFVFVVDRLERVRLATVANQHFQVEGFSNPEQFKNEWMDIHPRRGYDSEQRVWLHWFRRKDPRHQPHYTPTEIQMGLDREWMTLSDGLVGASCNCETKTYDDERANSEHHKD